MRRLVVFLVLAALAAGACVPQPTPTPVAPTRTLAPLPPPTHTPAPIVTSAPTETLIEVPTETPSISTLAPTVSPIPPTVTATEAPTETLGVVPAMERRLADTPIFVNFSPERERAIFALGASQGSRADVFTTVGDSNTTNGDFLQPIGMGEDMYCNWGSYGDLRDTVAFFSVPPDDESKTSFTHHSLAAAKGFTSAAALDPFWVSDAYCAANESPLACEYRITQPSVAIIMLGNIDVSSLTTDAYAANMRRIVEFLLQRGVIPVLTTFVVLPERDQYQRSLEMNMALLDIADAEQVPLINLWAPAQALPDHGIGPDHTHLKAEVGSFCSFDGAQNQYGGTLRNLLTLQALDTLRRDVLSP